jgi:hypothetical protein
MVGLALVVIGYIGVFFGRMIQAAVSRQREYLADAAAVQFTRNPSGIGGALQKIGASSAGSRITDHHAQEAGHFFFANGIGSAFTSLLATHPPLTERIRRIDAGVLENRPRAAAATGASKATGVPAAAGRETAGQARGGSSALAPAMAGAALMASIGTPQQEHVAYAGRLLDGLPQRVRTAAHEPDQAAALLFALLLQPEPQDDTRQWQAIEAHGGPALVAEVETLLPDVRAAGSGARLPVLDLLLPALRELAPEQQDAVQSTAGTLVAADDRIDMFELALMHVLGRQLAGGRRAPHAAGDTRGGSRLSALRDEAQLVLSAVAWSGAAGDEAARQTFSAGAAAVQHQTGALSLQPRDALPVARIDAALGRLRTAVPGARRAFMDACVLVIAEDGRVHPQEAELLRAVAEAIDCPMPPAAFG